MRNDLCICVFWLFSHNLDSFGGCCSPPPHPLFFQSINWSSPPFFFSSSMVVFFQPSSILLLLLIRMRMMIRHHSSFRAITGNCRMGTISSLPPPSPIRVYSSLKYLLCEIIFLLRLNDSRNCRSFLGKNSRNWPSSKRANQVFGVETGLLTRCQFDFRALYGAYFMSYRM